ncbi:DUF3179 domain-containing protein [Haloferax chudinovii]|uniref:DUF3179 domain-containing protein n=1 Tax=Haloferax chudinovii TaxID=1109010 RepID=A0ABD5XNP2_9EURY
MNVRQVIPRDAIPSIDDPEFDTDYAGDGTDEVVVVEGEPTKAYPVRILNYHEVVNDDVDDIPLAVTWCPLCGSAVVYDRRVDDRTLTFGVSGKLADDDLVMYDRETDSEWKQSLGHCISGELEGESLSVVPASLTTYAEFEDAYSDGTVLQPTVAKSEAASKTDEPADIDYGTNPYQSYFETDGFGLGAHRGTGQQREWTRTDLDPKTVVLGIEGGNDAVGFPLPRIEEAGGLVVTTVGDREVVVVSTHDGLHAFENPPFDLDVTDDGRLVGDGTHWSAVSGQSDDGRSLTRGPSRRLFAFAWQDDHGGESFYK